MSAYPTQGELARALGLTRETVNAALHGGRYNRRADRSKAGTRQCSDDTIKLVAEAAVQMGYVTPDEQPSMAKIGKALRLSHVTVRNALRGLGGVSEETRDRVRAKAEEMGYEVPPLVKRDQGGRW